MPAAVTSSCWDPNNVNVCDQNLLLCTKGAVGPLCGACEKNFVYGSAARECLPCSVGATRAVFTVGALLAVIVVLFASQSSSPFLQSFFRLPSYMDKWFVVGMVRKVDSGGEETLLVFEHRKKKTMVYTNTKKTSLND